MIDTVDTSKRITPAAADALWAAGIRKIIRTSNHLPGYEGDNYSADEHKMLTSKGFEIFGIYNDPVKPTGYVRNFASGAAEAEEQLVCALAAGMTSGRMICDAEGNAGEAWLSWCQGWISVMKRMQGQFRRTCYDGIGFAQGLTTAEKDGLEFDDWWDAGAFGSHKPSKGYFLRQLPAKTFGGESFDMNDTLATDADLAQWLDSLSKPLPGETAGEHIWRAVTAFDGVSLDHEPEKLRILAQVDDKVSPETWAALKTNCATTMRWLLALVGCPIKLITQPDVSGMSMSWDIEAAREAGALIACTSGTWRQLRRGWGMHYGTPGKNDDHVEWCGSTPDDNGIADHAGGGRDANAIATGRGDIRTSWGRPLLHIINPDKMSIPTVPALPTPKQQPVSATLTGNAGVAVGGMVAVTAVIMAISAIWHGCH